METTVFNPIQRHLLEMFSYDKSQEGLEELKEVLFQYYSKRMNTKLDELWDKGILDQKKLDEIAEMDIHSLKKRQWLAGSWYELSYSKHSSKESLPCLVAILCGRKEQALCIQ